VIGQEKSHGRGSNGWKTLDAIIKEQMQTITAIYQITVKRLSGGAAPLFESDR
jgi:hypothetical protein